MFEIIKIEFPVNVDGHITAAHKSTIHPLESEEFIDTVRRDVEFSITPPPDLALDENRERDLELEQNEDDNMQDHLTEFIADFDTIAIYDGAENVQIHYIKVG